MYIKLGILIVLGILLICFIRSVSKYRPKYMFYRSILEVLCLCVIIALIMCLFQVNKESWQNYWAVIGSILGVLGAILIYLETKKTEEEKGRAELDKKRKEEKINNFETAFNQLLYGESPKLLSISSKLKDIESFKDNEEEIKTEMAGIFFQYRKIEDKRKELSEFLDDGNRVEPMDSEKNDEIIKNVLDPMKDISNIQKILEYIYTSENFTEIKEDIFNSFELDEIKAFFERQYKPPTLNSSVKKIDGKLQSEDYPAVLGNWIASVENAKHVNYLIGISIKTKDIIAIYRVKYSDEHYTDAERINFDNSSKKLLYSFNNTSNDEQSNQIQEIKNSLLSWTSRNPVMYYNAWNKKPNSEEDYVYKFIEDNTKDDKQPYTNRYNIMVVKTNQYDKEISDKKINDIINDYINNEATPTLTNQVKDKLDDTDLAFFDKDNQFSTRTKKDAIKIPEDDGNQYICVKFYTKNKEKTKTKYEEFIKENDKDYSIENGKGYNLLVPWKNFHKFMRKINEDIKDETILPEAEVDFIKNTKGIFFEKNDNLNAVAYRPNKK